MSFPLLDRREADFDRRGFRLGDAASTEHLTIIGRTFVEGYNAAWMLRAPALQARVGGVDPELRGFAHEGAAMALMLGDVLLPWRRSRWMHFTDGPAKPHIYLAFVGAGWAFARLGRIRPRFDALDPLLRWLIFDGCGFHDAYFRPRDTVSLQRRSRRSHRAAEIYDQGVGRALWFVECANPDAIADTIETFALARRANLWSGVGLAATYAGGMDGAALRRLRHRASGFEPHLAQGSAFAAKARDRAATVDAECELAVQILCGCTSSDAARATDLAAAQVEDRGRDDAYESWRDATRRLLGERRVVA